MPHDAKKRIEYWGSKGKSDRSHLSDLSFGFLWPPLDPEEIASVTARRGRGGESDNVK